MTIDPFLFWGMVAIALGMLGMLVREIYLAFFGDRTKRREL